MKLSGLFALINLGLLCGLSTAQRGDRDMSALRKGARPREGRIDVAKNVHRRAKGKSGGSSGGKVQPGGTPCNDDGRGGCNTLGNIGCFSERATVQVQGSTEPVSMKELKVGDRVLASTGKYEPVYAFGHRHPFLEAEFFQLYTYNSETPLEMTGEHLVFLHNKQNPVRASSIKEGDLLQSTATIDAMEVKKIRKIRRHGLYVPLTASGKVVVDGIQASSYVVLQDDAEEHVELSGGYKILSYQNYVHLTLAPFRLLCNGVSPNLCQHYDEDGMPYYIGYGIGFIRWGSQQNVFVHALVLLVVATLSGFCWVLEKMFGAKRAPLAAVAMIATFWIKRRASRNHKAKIV